MKYLLLIVVVLLLSSCSDIFRNEGVLKEDLFIDVLVDIHLADATIVVKGLRINTDSTNIRLFYKDVLLKHNVTQEQINTTLLFYSKKPRDFEKIYEKVSEKIIRLSDEYKLSVSGKG